ncbi:flagellar hook assembly protein FlgD [Salinicola rhizosphaerae]|uniref:Basal-body rod modification protein FlgD n=1 Tax=Salinicola rhizosphaerae TaxID=1443141 RepID=A0ABQ3DP44_9GAMM|nr:flagellar hook assembly protein FlgD [Salinicola rhizosphaerae]GHB08551.1 basal-body rod modification protein FlgD [Salinicola rhizosphaerae]
MASPVIGSTTLANINGTTSTSTTTGTSSSDELNDRFMTMLITQLKNQDPTNPMDNSDMTAQLAQINTVSGIEDLNDSLDKINDQIGAGQALQATALIGQGVMVPGDQILVGTSDDTTGEVAATPVGVDLDSAVDDLQITIKGANGQAIDSFSTGPLSAGVHSFTWDGTLSDGSYASADQTYSVEMTAVSGDSSYTPTTLNYALVNGVIQSDDGSPTLDLGYAQDPVTLDDVRQIL